MERFILREKDIRLVTPTFQRRYAMLKITNRALQDVCTIHGQFISGNISIDATSDNRRSGNISMIVARSDIRKISEISTTNFVRVYWGVQDNTTMELSWYRQGTFIVAKNSFSFDPQTRTLSLTLTDRMSDLSGERKGVLHAYSTVVKNSQRVDDLMKSVLELGGVNEYDIIPICPLKTTSDVEAEQSPDDLLVPFDFKFGEGVTIHDILEKCVTLYPYYEMFFDVDGKFICQKKVLDGDNALAVLDESILRPMTLSEDTTFTVFDIKNYVEIWGKEGKYYGEAKDNRIDSPFAVSSIGEFRVVETYEQVYDRYRDIAKAEELLKQQAKYENQIAVLEAKEKLSKEEQQLLLNNKSNLEINLNAQKVNVAVHGNDMATAWAKQKLEEHCRLNESITIHCVGLPCINDAGFKINRRNKIDATPYTYVVQSVNHDLGSNTTDITATRFYGGQAAVIKYQMSPTTVTQSVVTGMTISVTAEEVENADSYILYVDGAKVAESPTPTIEFTAPPYMEGEHEITISASGDGYITSQRTPPIKVDFETEDINTLITDSGDNISTDDGENLLID